MNLRVLCVGDSLGLPREGCRYENTWIYMLKQANPQDDYINSFIRLLTSKDLQKGKGIKGDFSNYYNPDVVILQLGVCDCAPRYYNSKSTVWKIIEKTGVMLLSEKLYWKLIKILRKRSANSQFVSIDKFTKYINNYIECLVNDIKVKGIVIIQIATPSKRIQEASPEFLEQIEKYNLVYNQISSRYPNVVTVISPLKTGDDQLYVDGYHTNKNGSEAVFSDVNKQLELIRNRLS